MAVKICIFIQYLDCELIHNIMEVMVIFILVKSIIFKLKIQYALNPIGHGIFFGMNSTGVGAEDPL